MLSKAHGHFGTKLLDFGIAKAMELDETVSSGQTATRSDLRAFTLAYASPEQIGGTRSGPWTDVHALALLLVEVLTDRAPFRGEDNTALTVDVLSTARPTPAKFGLDVGAWEPILARALALRPVERFQHARDFLRALEADVPASASWDALTTAPVIGSRTPPDRTTTLQPVQQPATVRPSRTPLVVVASLAATLSFVAFYLVGASPPPPVAAPARVSAIVAPSAPAPVPASVVAVAVPVVATAETHDAGVPGRVVVRPARPVVPTRPLVVARPRVHEHVPVE
jgi:serine/threonine-protein kinase